MPLGSSPTGRSEDELAALELDVTGAALLEAASGRASQTLAAAVESVGDGAPPDEASVYAYGTPLLGVTGSFYKLCWAQD